MTQPGRKVMPRPAREFEQGSTHHCWSICQGRNDLLNSLHGRQFFIQAIKMCQEKYKFELIAVENAKNHFHLIIRTIEGEADISRIMQYIKSRAAWKYNRATGRTGPYWNDRFKNKVVEKSTDPQQYLLYLLWYIAYNPCTKGLSSNPRYNEIGFINCYLYKNHEAPVKITRHYYFIELGRTHNSRVRKLLFHEQKYLDHRAKMGKRAWDSEFW
jgi:REP element-mobilizing transposase RayT